MQALVLPVGSDRYALALTDVREVVRAPAPWPLPGAPPTVLGLINLRGEVVPVLDTAALLGIGRMEAVAYAAVADTDAGPAALAADGVPLTARLDQPAGAGSLDGAVERFSHDGGLVTVLDVSRLLAPGRVAGA